MAPHERASESSMRNEIVDGVDFHDGHLDAVCIKPERRCDLNMSGVTVHAERGGQRVAYWSTVRLRLAGVNRLAVEILPTSRMTELTVEREGVRIDPDLFVLAPTSATSVRIEWVGPVSIVIGIQSVFLEVVSLDEPHM